MCRPREGAAFLFLGGVLSLWLSPSLALPTRGRVGVFGQIEQQSPPSPLWGGLGRGWARHRIRVGATPTPVPSPQGEGDVLAEPGFVSPPSQPPPQGGVFRSSCLSMVVPHPRSAPPPCGGGREGGATNTGPNKTPPRRAAFDAGFGTLSWLPAGCPVRGGSRGRRCLRP